MSQFIESIRVENQKICLLAYHQARVNATFAHFGSQGRLTLAEIFENLSFSEDGLCKLRVAYDLDGNYNTQLLPYKTPKIAGFQLVVNNFVDYAFKYEDRGVLIEMKNSAQAEEIIIVKNNHIIDTSFSNLLFLKDGLWFTPSTYLLNGVMRQFLLKNGIIEEAEITLQNIGEYTHFQVINAMNRLNESMAYPISSIKNLHGDIINFNI